MKKIVIATISLFLASVFAFAGCDKINLGGNSGSNDDSSNSSGSGSTSEQEVKVEYENDGYGNPSMSTQFDLGADVEGTTHIFNVAQTDYKIVENGTSSYKILIPEKANDFEVYAADELQYFFQDATGVKLPIERDNGNAAYDSSAKYLSIGETKLRAECGVSFDYQTLGANGYKIDTYGQSVIMSGNGKQGTLYAMYEFLHQAFDWEAYGPDCVVYEKNVKELALSDYEIIDVPDIPWRQVTAGLTGDEVYTRRLRFNQPEEIMAYPGGWCHNTFHAIRPQTYLAEHPEWYARDKRGNIIGDIMNTDWAGQICYTCDDPELYNVALTSLIQWLEDSPDVENVMFSQQDTNDWCECENCTAEYKTYGTHAAAVIKFVNKLRRMLDPWCEQTGRNVVVSFFAYLKTEDAPVKKVDGEWVPIDESVICDEGVGVMFAPIGADYSKSLVDPSNSAEYENMMKWPVLCDKMYLWTYQTDFADYLVPYNSYNSMQEIYKLARRTNTFWLLDQQQSYQYNCTGFTVLKYYLSAKLAWDVNADVNELIDNFFEGYFGVAAEPMRKLFDELRARFSYIENDLNIAMYIYVDLKNKNFWPEGLLVQWLGYIDDAYAAIEPLKEKDENTYYLIKDRLLLEGISYRFLLIHLYGATYYDATTLLQEKLQWKADCAYLGVNRVQEGGTALIVDWLLENWGV